MSDTILRAGVIGLGAMGAHHARVYAEMPGVELVAVCDADGARVAQGAGERGIRGYSDARAMLDGERLDLVSIAVPTRAHLDVALDAIARGVALLIEKPLAATLDEGARLRAAAAAAGVPMTVGHIERFNPAVLAMKARVQAGELGRVLQVHARRVGPFPRRVRDVGVVLDLAPHDIDLMRFITGSEVTRVQAETEQRINTDHEDMLSGLLRFANGVVGVLDVNWLTPTKIRELAVLGSRGMFIVDELARELTFFENDFHARDQQGDWAAHHLKGVSEGRRTSIVIDKREPLRAELEAFARTVADGAPPAVTADDALAAMAVAEALVRAAETHAAIELVQPAPA
ncbi:MAG: Gfo/Idh/MocA family oxidoreductase [Dehalococcoidia bacterium]|nr:Gfo/Idh/MocA family oxidoreductase [Dehalococcoidia bacterium]